MVARRLNTESTRCVIESFLAKFAQPPLARDRKKSNGGKDGVKGKDYEKDRVRKWMPEWKTGRDWLMFDAEKNVMF